MLLWPGAVLGQNGEPSEADKAEQSQIDTPHTKTDPAPQQSQPADLPTEADVGLGRSVKTEDPPSKAHTEHKSPEEEANDIARRDLAAQQSMAGATLQMAWSAWIQVGIGVAALILLWLTVRYTKKAAIYARQANIAAHEAVEATQEANEIALKMGQVQVRAYMSAYNCRTGVTGVRVPVIEFMLKNAGQSPARNVCVTIDIEAFETDSADRSLGNASEMRAVGDFAAGADAPFSMSFNASASKDPNTRNAFNGAGYHRVSVHLQYEDVFSDRWADRYHTEIRQVRPGDRSWDALLVLDNRCPSPSGDQ